MKKLILGLLAAFLLIMPAMPVAAVEVSQDNEGIDYTFSDIDGGEITTQSEGKPKLLIFFGAECGNCKATLAEISSSEWIKTGETDVCAIEVWSGHTEEKVREFKNEYCPEGTIRFAAGENRGFNAADKYNKIAGDFSGRFTTPLISMIDVENKVRYVTTGYISAADIETYLPALSLDEDNSQEPDQTPDENEPENPGETPDEGKPDATPDEDGAGKPDTTPDEDGAGKPDATPDEGETGKPNETPDKDAADKPAATPDSGKVDGTKEEPEETKAEKVACNHVWEKVSVNNATATNDAVSAQQCIKCGAINRYEMIPNSAYASFLEETANTILNAKQEEVVINTQIWTSFNRTVFHAIQSRPDVSVNVNYFYKGKQYALRIPAGVDVSLLMDANGYGGFRYIDQVLNTLS